MRISFHGARRGRPGTHGPIGNRPGWRSPTVTQLGKLPHNLGGALLFVVLAGCRNDMQDQPRYRPLQPSRFFADGRSARPLPDGTVARGHLRTDTAYFTGHKPGVPTNVETLPPSEQNPDAPLFDPTLVTEFPVPVTREMMARGRERYEIFCTPCHGYLGNGRGMIVQRGLSPPPSFHADRLRNAPVGHFFDVITNGFGAMYSYAARVPVADRWAIIAYIRALQYSEAVPASEVPPDELARMPKDQAPPQRTGPGELHSSPVPSQGDPYAHPGVKR